MVLVVTVATVVPVAMVHLTVTAVTAATPVLVVPEVPEELAELVELVEPVPVLAATAAMAATVATPQVSLFPERLVVTEPHSQEQEPLVAQVPLATRELLAPLALLAQRASNSPTACKPQTVLMVTLAQIPPMVRMVQPV